MGESPESGAQNQHPTTGQSSRKLQRPDKKASQGKVAYVWPMILGAIFAGIGLIVMLAGVADEYRGTRSVTIMAGAFILLIGTAFSVLVFFIQARKGHGNSASD